MAFILRLLVALTGRTEAAGCDCCDKCDSCPDCP